MNIKAIKRLALVVVALIITLFTQSCFDLGGYETDGTVDLTNISDHDFKEYYKRYIDCFSNIKLIDQEVKSEEYDLMLSFFNPTSINDLRHWDTYGNAIPYKEYAYLSFKVKKDIEIDSLSLYIKGQGVKENAKMKIHLFILDDFSDNGDYATYDIFETEMTKEVNDESDRKTLSDYDDPKVEDAIRSSNVSLSNSWNSFTMTFFTKENKGTSPLLLKENKMVVLMFENNMGLGYSEEKDKISFCSTDLLIRAHE